MFCWLIEHNADLLNKYQKSDDGRTAYHRLRGKSWSLEMVEFGEKVHYRINRKALAKEYNPWDEGTSWV